MPTHITPDRHPLIHALYTAKEVRSSPDQLSSFGLTHLQNRFEECQDPTHTTEREGGGHGEGCGRRRRGYAICNDHNQTERAVCSDSSDMPFGIPHSLSLLLEARAQQQRCMTAGQNYRQKSNRPTPPSAELACGQLIATAQKLQKDMSCLSSSSL